MNQNNTDYELFQYWRSSCSWRVRWALNYKKIAYKSRSVHLKNKEHHSQEWRQNHPGGLLPQLHYKDHIMGQSLSIIEWIEETHPKPALLPTTAYDRQYIRQLSYIIACDTQPIQNLRLLPENNPKEYAAKWIREGLKTFDQCLDKDKVGVYCYFNHLTLADICLIPQWYNALRFGISEDEFPTLARIYTRCLERPDCQKAHPSNQEAAEV